MSNNLYDIYKFKDSFTFIEIARLSNDVETTTAEKQPRIQAMFDQLKADAIKGLFPFDGRSADGQFTLKQIRYFDSTRWADWIMWVDASIQRHDLISWFESKGFKPAFLFEHQISVTIKGGDGGINSNGGSIAIKGGDGGITGNGGNVEIKGGDGGITGNGGSVTIKGGDGGDVMKARDFRENWLQWVKANGYAVDHLEPGATDTGTAGTCTAGTTPEGATQNPEQPQPIETSDESRQRLLEWAKVRGKKGCIQRVANLEGVSRQAIEDARGGNPMKKEEGWNDWHKIPFPDWSYWRQIPEPTLIECVLLSLNAEPMNVQDWWSEIAEVNERIEIAVHHARAGRLNAPIPHLSYMQRRQLAHDNYDLDPYEINRIDYFTSPEFDYTRQILVRIDLVEFSQWAISLGWKIPKKMKAMTKPPKVKATPGPISQPAPSPEQTGHGTSGHISTQEDQPAQLESTDIDLGGDAPAPQRQDKLATAAIYKGWHDRYVQIKAGNPDIKDSEVYKTIHGEHSDATGKKHDATTIGREIRRIKNSS